MKIARFLNECALLGLLCLPARAALLDESDPLQTESDETSARISLPSLNAPDSLGSLLDASAQQLDLAAKIDEARAEIARNPDNARPYRLLGELLTRANRLDEAAQAYWNAARLQPLNAGPLHYFGFTLLALGDHRNGLEIYKQLESRHPDARKVLFNLGSAYYGIKDYEKAAQYLNKFIATSRREDPRASYNLGIVHLAQNQPEKAIPLLEKSLERMVSNPFVLAALIRANHAADRDRIAKTLLETADKRFGLDAFNRILDAETPPAFLDR